MNINGFEVSDGILDLTGIKGDVIEDKAFLSAKTVRSVKVPKGIVHIGDWAFAKCTHLASVVFEGEHSPGLFGKEVFSGCEMLRSISFAGMDDVTAGYLALCTNKLPFDHLLRSDDIGSKSWYEKWDICLVSTLKSDDEKLRMNAALCGEEDISYDGIGSVDGEMPGQSADYVIKEEFKKCSLSYFRLANDRYLTDDTRAVIERYISGKRWQEGSGSAFYSIFEEGDNALLYLRIYLDIVKPDRQTLLEMTGTVAPKDVYAISCLIKEAGKSDTLDGLLL